MPLAYQLDVVTVLVILIFLFTIGSLRSLVKGNWRKNVNREQTLYEDKDGIANPESAAQFSNKWQYIVIFGLNSIGLGVSVANTVYTIVKQKSGTASTDSQLGSSLLMILAWVSPNTKIGDIKC
jgi:hypothetical protein